MWIYQSEKERFSVPSTKTFFARDEAVQVYVDLFAILVCIQLAAKDVLPTMRGTVKRI